MHRWFVNLSVCLFVCLSVCPSFCSSVSFCSSSSLPPSSGYLRNLIEETTYFGFPCVHSNESQLLAGFITRKDIRSSLGELKKSRISYVHPFLSPSLPPSLPPSFHLSELVASKEDEGIQPESRVFFMDSALRLSQTMLDSDIPSVNIRGVMDQVSLILEPSTWTHTHSHSLHTTSYKNYSQRQLLRVIKTVIKSY